MQCTNCEKEPILARGYCRRCYQRFIRNGSVERRNVQNKGATCSIADCDGSAFAKGLCQKHYDRSRHPLLNTWKMMRSRNPGSVVVAWDRFETFLADVGERPTEKHQLRRLRSADPYGPGNIEWASPITVRDYYAPDQRAAYEREWRFQRRFGITVADYDRMLAAQGGLCALCRRPPTQVHAKSGKLRDLAVDHDHATGTVRALLCTDCNTALGLMRDDPALLRAAADYLDRHSRPHLVRTGEAA